MSLSKNLSTAEEMKESADIFSGLSFEKKQEILRMQQLGDREMAKVAWQHELELKKVKV